MEGETITHKYTPTGSYEVKIVALSGGVAKTTTQTVVIANPINLPITLKRQYLPLEILWCFCWCKQSKYWSN
jgi:hypothetical protein